MHHPTDRIAHTTAFVTPVRALAGMRNSSMGPPHEGSIRRPTTRWANILPLSYISLLLIKDTLLLIWNSQWRGGSRFPLSLSEPSLTIPYVWFPTTVNKNISFLPHSPIPSIASSRCIYFPPTTVKHLS